MREDRIAIRYVDADGKIGQEAGTGEARTGNQKNPANPNGSLDDIAGILNKSRTVLGMMPHPERLADQALGGDDGRPMFDGLIAALG